MHHVPGFTYLTGYVPTEANFFDFAKWGPLNLLKGTAIIKEVIPDYYDWHTACVFEREANPQPDTALIELAASFKVDDVFAASPMVFSDVH